MMEETKRSKAAEDNATSIAAALKERLSWEIENGVEGYSIDTSLGALDVLRKEIGDCRRCGLANGRTNIVFGEGYPGARLVFVGEGPGKDEDLLGRPFVGAAGQLLDRIVGAMGMSRGEVYICNVVKCRPPNNRTPTSEECSECGRFLTTQLAILKPEVVVALGSTASRFLLDTDKPISGLRGRFHSAGGLKVMPTYHPAYLLRNPSAKRPVWEDMLKVKQEMGLEDSPEGKRL